MPTITDYLNYYKNTPIQEVHWNAVDNLLCSILVYLPLPSYSGKKTLEEFYHYSMEYVDQKDVTPMIAPAMDFLEKIHDSIRYRDLKISNFENFRNNDTQFGAATFVLENLTVIAYKGSDDSIIGWLENFRLTYEYPTYTHTLAIDYLRANAPSCADETLFVCGHSKGGNLALVAAMEADDSVFRQIKTIYNFDGPGLRKDEFLQKKFQKAARKLVNLVPSGSVVGILMNNTDYQVVKSSSMAINEHYPTSWNLFGEFFVEAKLSSVSRSLHEATTTGLENLDYEITKEAIETIFQSFGEEYASDFNLSFEMVTNFYSNMKSVTPEVRKSLDTIFEMLLKSEGILPRIRKNEKKGE